MSDDATNAPMPDAGTSTPPPPDSADLPRRALLKRLAVASVALPLLSQAACERTAPGGKAASDGAAPAGGASSSVAGAGPRGTPSDPDLVNPRATWPLVLTEPELATVTVLCDLIIPADDTSPSASTVGVPAYINEYVSAPYPGHQRALVQVRGGLAWLNTESRKRHGRPFTDLTAAEQSGICDDICYVPKAKPEHQAAARFFARMRNLTAEGFYTTDAGMKDIGYVGNVPLPKWELPPPEVLRHLGLSPAT